MVSLHAFASLLRATGRNDTVLLDFTADWCGPCRLMQPTIQRLRDAGYPVRQVNVDREPDLTRQFRVGPIPCFVFVRDGRESTVFVARRVTIAGADAEPPAAQPPDSGRCVW